MTAILILVCYLIGSIPIAWLTAKVVTGQDLRRLGSGNLGVMNVALSVARWAGLLVFLAEAAKGVLAVVLARYVGGGVVAIGLAVLAAVVGTRWSVWLRGAGGRGQTVGMAALMLVSWQTLVSALVVWLLLRLVTGSSFLAARINLVVWPFVLGLFIWSWWAVLFGVVYSMLFLSTHERESDDHLRLKERWPSMVAFFTSPPRG